MAATVAEVTGSSWLLSSGAIGSFLTLLLLFIILTTLCSDCRRNPSEVQDTKVNRTPSMSCLSGQQVKMEEASVTKENRATSEVHTDDDNAVSFTPWRSHLGAPYTDQDVKSSRLRPLTVESSAAVIASSTNHGSRKAVPTTPPTKQTNE